MPKYRVLITTAEARGQTRIFMRHVRAYQPEDAVDIACSGLGIHRDLEPSEEPVGTWYSRACGVRCFARRGRRFGTVSPGNPPAATLAALMRA